MKRYYKYIHHYFITHPNFWFKNCIHPDDKQKIDNIINEVAATLYSEKSCIYRIIDSEGHISRVKGTFMSSTYGNNIYILIVEEFIK